MLRERARAAPAAVPQTRAVRQLDDKMIPEQTGRIRQRQRRLRDTVRDLHGQQGLADAFLPETKPDRCGGKAAVDLRCDAYTAAARRCALRFAIRELS